MDYAERAFSFPGPTELNCFYCGKRMETYDHVFEPRLFEYHILVYIRSGSALFKSSRGIHRIKGPALLVMFPFELVSYRADPGIPWTIWWVCVGGKMLDPLLESLKLTRDNPVAALHNPMETEAAFESLFRSMEFTGFSERLESLSALLRLFSVLSRNNRQEEDDIALLAAHIIEYSYPQALTLSSIADSLHVDKCYLAKKFRAATGETIGNTIRNVRIQRACALLQNTDIPVQEVATSVGISDSLYFSRLFRKVMGESPSEYRKRKKGSQTEGFVL